MTSDLEPLIHIGYHKTGTTWLQRRVFTDAALGFATVSPPRVLDDLFVDQSPFEFDAKQALEGLRPFIEDAEQRRLLLAISHERLSGDPMQGSLDSRAIADRLAATFPRARVLIGIRDQRAMLLSFFKQVTTRSLRRDRVEQFLEQRLRGFGRPSTLWALEYDQLISYYQTIFGHDRVLVVAYETTKDPLGFVRRITDLVGLPAPVNVDATGENVGVSAAAVAATRYLNMVAHTLNLDRILIGPTAKPSAISARLRVMRRIGALAPESMSKRIEAKWWQAIDDFLGPHFGASNRRTAELTGLDLAALGYVT